MKIGMLAKLAETPVETIRYYEREALLGDVVRHENNYRIYGTPHVERLRFIRHCRSLDMSLDEIRQLLQLRDAPSASCDEVNAILEEHIAHVTTRIRALQQLKRQLQQLQHSCHEAQSLTHCSLLDELAQLNPPEGTAPARGGGRSDVHPV